MRGPARRLVGLFVSAAWMAATWGPAMRAAEPDAATWLQAKQGVRTTLDDQGRVEQVAVRDAPLDAPMVAALARLPALHTLELYQARVTGDAWKALVGLSQLRHLKIRDTVLGFGQLQRLTAGNDRLTIDYPWPVGLRTTPLDELVVELPMATLVFADIRPLPTLEQRFEFEWAGAARRSVEMKLLPPRPSLDELRSDISGHIPYCAQESTGEGAVGVILSTRTFVISNDGMRVAIGGRSFPIVAPRRTIVVDEKGIAAVVPYWIRFRKHPGEGKPSAKEHDVNVLWFETVENDASPYASDSSGGVELTDLERRLVANYAESNPRYLTMIYGPHCEGTVCYLGPNRPVEDLRAPGLLPSMSETRLTRYGVNGNVGVTILFKGVFGENAVQESSHSGVIARRVSNTTWRSKMAGARLQSTQFRLTCMADQGDMLLQLGNAAEGSRVRIDGAGKSIEIGGRTISLTPGVHPTINLAGDTTQNQPLSVVPIDTEEDAAAAPQSSDALDGTSQKEVKN